jgi:hypothetical protein
LVPAAATAAGVAKSKIADLMAVVGTPKLAAEFGPQVAAAVQAAVEQATVHGIR